MNLNASLGGQTTMLGKETSVIGKVSVVVDIGYLAQSTKACAVR